MHRSTTLRNWIAVGALAGTMLLAACGSGGYQRGIFTGYVVDATEEEITNKVGKPDQVDGADPNAPRWIYVKKTFDPDNMNQIDAKTIVVMKKDEKTGKLKGAEVIFTQ
jgi:type IV secretory pathway TrbF-like protein